MSRLVGLGVGVPGGLCLVLGGAGWGDFGYYLVGVMTLLAELR